MTTQHGANRSGKTPAHVYLWRYASGHHMDGIYRTNAGWFTPATRDITPHGRASKWAHRPRAHRAVIRWASAAITLATLYGYFVSRTLTVDTVLGALAALAALGIIRARYLWVNRKHHKRLVRPFWQTATMITGTGSIHPHAYGSDHRKFITFPRNYRNDPKARIRMIIPETWEARGPDIKRLNELANRKFGGEWDIVTHFSEYPPCVEFVPSPAPPASLAFADILPAIAKSRDSEIVLGKGTHDRILSIDLDSESPHIAIAAGTGGGKSTILRMMICQLIAKGAERIDILDIKRASHSWAKGIPGVYIHTTMASIMQAVSEFRKEMENRYDALEAETGERFPRRVLIIEEQNSLMAFARQYWADYRAELDSQERNRVPKTNPMISDIGFILFMGRQSNMNVVSVFQRMTANASGDTAMRDQYGCKLLSRFSPASWRSLVGTTPIPRSSRIPGRGIMVLGEDDKAIQFALLTEDEAKAYAREHARKEETEATPSALGSVEIPANAGADDVPAMSLRELVEAGIVPVRYSTAKRIRSGADDFPEGIKTPSGILYRPDAVRGYFASRKTRASR